MNRHYKKVRDNVAPELWQRFVGAEQDVEAADQRLGNVLREIEVATRPPGSGEWLPLPSMDLHDRIKSLANRVRRGPLIQGDQ